jgi:hypothetical protein
MLQHIRATACSACLQGGTHAYDGKACGMHYDVLAVKASSWA